MIDDTKEAILLNNENPGKDAKSMKNTEKAPIKAEKKTGISEKSKPALHYVIIMFTVALLLLVLTFFMQQRNHVDLKDELSSAAMNMQKVVDLELELETTEDELAALQEDYDELKAAYDKSMALEIATEESLLAMENLLNLQTLYLNGDTEAAEILIDEMEKEKLYSFLPAESNMTDVDAPFTIYEKIKAILK